MNLTGLRGRSLWTFAVLPSRTLPPVVVNLVVLALVPLLAIRLGTKTASFVVLGLAVVTALSVADAALSRFGVRIPLELTLGFWLTAAASAVLFVLVGSLRHDAPVPSVVG